MKFSFEVGQAEPHTVEFYWGQWFGNLEIKIDGRIVEEKQFMLFSPSSFTHKIDAPENEKLNLLGIEILLVEKWNLEVGIYEKHNVRIEKERTKILSGFRPNTYRVFVDDELIEKHKGF
jgi:hypothetical protein